MIGIDRILERDFDWRQAELAQLKLLVTGAREAAPILRALWVMLYAHFEGFCISSAQQYLDSLSRRSMRQSDFTEAMQVLALKREFGLLFGNQSVAGRVKFLRSAQGLADTVATFEMPFEVGNLWPETFESLLEALDLPATFLDPYAKRIELLVDRRNDIAHGRDIIVRSLAEYQPFEDAALTVMTGFALEICDRVGTKRYLRSEKAS